MFNNLYKKEKLKKKQRIENKQTKKPRRGKFQHINNYIKCKLSKNTNKDRQ